MLKYPYRDGYSYRTDFAHGEHLVTKYAEVPGDFERHRLIAFTDIDEATYLFVAHKGKPRVYQTVMLADEDMSHHTVLRNNELVMQKLLHNKNKIFATKDSDFNLASNEVLIQTRYDSIEDAHVVILYNKSFQTSIKEDGKIILKIMDHKTQQVKELIIDPTGFVTLENKQSGQRVSVERVQLDHENVDSDFAYRHPIPPNKFRL